MEHYNPNGDATTPSLVNISRIKHESVLEAALEYHRRGLIATPLHGKRPILRHWHERPLDANDLVFYFGHGRNVGIVLGGPAGIVDVDLDDPLAREVADLLLPDTILSGREKSPRSHRWFICDPVPASRKYSLTKPMAERLKVEPEDFTLVELRSTGQQTVVAPSIHPVESDRYLWHPSEIREIDGEELAELVRDVAVAALLALNRPLGSRERFAVRAANYLSSRVGRKRAEAIVGAASAAFDDEEHAERMRAVRASLREHLVGGPTIDAPVAELERLAPGVSALVSRWCRRGRPGVDREEV